VASPERAPALEHSGLTMAVDVALADATDRLLALAGPFAEVVASIGTPAIRARGLEWTVVETAVHVLNGLEYYAACIRSEDSAAPPRGSGETMPEYFARENRRQIDAEPERDPSQIARRIRDAARTLVAIAHDAGPDREVVFAAGYSEDVTTSVCAMIAELVVHGFDIAGSTGARWRVDPRAAVLAVYSTTAGLPLALDRSAAADEDIHLRLRLRHGVPFSIRIREGRVWSELAGDRPDAHVWADPVAYLMVGYGRWGVLRPLVGGRLVVWGRRPWVVLTVPKLFAGP
jgi:hypothetical protein